MRYLIISFIVLLISVYLGIEIGKANSYVLLAYNHWVIETSLWVALCAILLTFFILYFLIRILARSFGFKRQFSHWRRLRHYRKARLLTHRGLCELSEGYWHKAEQTLLKSAKLTSTPLIDYLGAAKAAQAQYAFDRRDNYLRRAHTSNRDSGIAIGLTQAELQIEAKQWEQALSTLQNLNQIKPNHSHILKLLAHVYRKLNEWGKCQALLPKLKKLKALREKEYEQLEYEVTAALIPQITPPALNEFWKSLPKHLRRDSKLTELYLQTLLQHKDDETALDVSEYYLKNQWDDTVVNLYGKIRAQNSERQLQHAEHWLKNHPQNDALLLTLGLLCIREKLWGKAKDYLTQSVEIKPSQSAYAALAETYINLNDNDTAQNYLRLAIK